jgi:hypothetical protein
LFLSLSLLFAFVFPAARLTCFFFTPPSLFCLSRGSRLVGPLHCRLLADGADRRIKHSAMLAAEESPFIVLAATVALIALGWWLEVPACTALPSV